ncbi:MAG: Hpt domain-containing protein [Luteolibacter sp.]
MEITNTGHPDCTPLLDFEQLEPFIEIGLTDFLDILGDVIHDVPEHLEKIHTAIRRGNSTELKSTTHSMRGMIANFGCIGMTSILRDLEYGAPLEPGQADAICSTLATLWQQSLSAIVDWQKSIPDFPS